MKNLLIVLAAIALLMAAGCANSYEGDHMAQARKEIREKMVVAVVPFQSPAEAPGAGLAVADVLANEVYALGGYVLVTPEVAAARTAAREGEALPPEEAGRMIGAAYILTGMVTEYGYRYGVGEQPAVGVTARLIEAETGKVLWSATRARTGSGWVREESLGLTVSRVCRELARSLHGGARSYASGNGLDEYEMQFYPAEDDDTAELPPENNGWVKLGPGRSDSMFASMK